MRACMCACVVREVEAGTWLGAHLEVGGLSVVLDTLECLVFLFAHTYEDVRIAKGDDSGTTIAHSMWI